MVHSIVMIILMLRSLLGHNGAGKTTAINVLTGMLRPDGGHIYYGEKDFAFNYGTIRKKLGLCVQKDILYDDLTGAEHIELIARLRGVPADDIPRYIIELSNRVD